MDFDFTTETITPDSTGVLTIGGVQGIELPAGTTAQRPTSNLVAGTTRFNSSFGFIEYWTGSTWTFGSAVTSVTLTAPSIFSVAGSPVNYASGGNTGAGTLALSLNNQAANTILAGPTTGSAAPAFRTIALSSGDLSDVAITSPTVGQVLSYNATTSKWVNTGQAAGSYSALISSWTLVSGSQYSAVVTHSLGTSNIVVQFYNAATNAAILVDSYVVTDNNNITVFVNGGQPSFSVRVIIIANGSSIAAGGSTPSSVLVQNQGVALSGTYTAINFANGLTATNAGGGVATVNTNSAQVIRYLSYFSASFESPNNSDWFVNALAPAIADPANAAISVRQFSNTTSAGVGCYVPIPTGATNIIFTYRGRAQTAPTSAGTLQFYVYFRGLLPGAATSSWSVGVLPQVSLPASTVWNYYTANLALSRFGLVAGDLYQFELVRNTAVAGNPAVNFLLAELTLSFT